VGNCAGNVFKKERLYNSLKELSEFSDLVVVIFTIQNLPLSAPFFDCLFLRFDLFNSTFIYQVIEFHLLFDAFHDSESNLIWFVEEFDVVILEKLVEDLPGKKVYLLSR